METIATIFCIALAIFLTLGLAGAIYEHRSTLPMVAVVFVAILIFGVMW